jgi:hypothetical protein
MTTRKLAVRIAVAGLIALATIGVGSTSAGAASQVCWGQRYFNTPVPAGGLVVDTQTILGPVISLDLNGDGLSHDTALIPNGRQAGSVEYVSLYNPKNSQVQAKGWFIVMVAC